LNPIGVAIVPSPSHVDPTHPEHPRRLQGAEDAIRMRFEKSLLLVDGEPASEEVLLRVHTPAHLDFLQRACAQAPAIIDYAPTYVSPDSLACARQAAGAVLAVVDAVLDGRASGGFAAIRPPGHHAPSDRAMGFCLLNNIAIAARAAQARGVGRVMIVDFDVHHGNGTQSIFDEDPSVLYLSTHQYGIYPGTGDALDRGLGRGSGFTVNVPLPAGAGDGAFERVETAILRPAAERFRPDLILVSAGFDAHWRDPLAGLVWTTGGIRRFAGSLVEAAERLCGGRIAFVLEGGYDPPAVLEGILACLAALRSSPLPLDELGAGPAPETDASSAVDRAADIHNL
jgi:acetoin utilization deacetylase AcuC-like enzyme